MMRTTSVLSSDPQVVEDPSKSSSKKKEKESLTKTDDVGVSTLRRSERIKKTLFAAPATQEVSRSTIPASGLETTDLSSVAKTKGKRKKEKQEPDESAKVTKVAKKEKAAKKTKKVAKEKLEKTEKQEKSRKKEKTKKTKADNGDMMTTEKFTAPFSNAIKKEYNLLVGKALAIPDAARKKKNMNFSSVSVSVNDLIAYQIGWGRLVNQWYEAGVSGEEMTMPGDGFDTWNYKGLALHFYKSYHYENPQKQHREFKRIVEQILATTEKEHRTGNLEKEGVWEWCRLKSGKEWTLQKWIQVNTVAPYKRAYKLIK